jgi:PEP-CTERM motif
MLADVMVTTTDRGYYYDYDFNDPTNKNYLTGQLNVGSTIGFHSFFAFNALTGLPGPIVGATLSLFDPVAGYSSTQPSETLTIDGFSGNLAALETGGTQSGEYNALASGTPFGTQTVGAANDGSFVTITLDAAAIAFLNAHTSTPFALGGYLAGIPPTDTSTRFVFGGSAFVLANDGNTFLTLQTAQPVPEPESWLLLLTTACASLFGWRLRRRQR